MPGGHSSWPTSCLWGGVDSTPEGQREGATVRLTSREKQNTEGAGQGMRGVSLKERKKEGEVFTLKNREGESQQLKSDWEICWSAGYRGKRAGRRRLPSASMEERRAAAHRAATAEHSAVFISALSDHNNMNESAMMGKGGRGRNEKEMIHVD